MNILVVDDELLIRWLFQRSLSKWGHTVVTAESVRDAYRVMKSDDFDAIIVDFSLPDGTYMSILDKVNELRYKPEKVVVCSGYSNYSVERHLFTDGLRTLSKPFTLQELKSALEK